MANAEKGSVRTLAVALASGTVVGVAGERNFNITYSAPSINTSAKGDAAETNMAGRYGSTVSVDCLYVNADAGQQRILTLLKAGSQVTLEILEDSSALQSATATITSITETHNDNEAATFVAEFDVDGAWA